MEINGLSSYQSVKPNKPAEPTAPAGGNIENRQPPSEPPPPQSLSDSSSVNEEALQLLEEILSQYTSLSELTDEEQDELSTKLEEAGLTGQGSVLNTTA